VRALLACSVLLFFACADAQRPPLTAPYRAGEPLVQEQALVGLAPDGSAAAVQLIDAEGAPPRLELLAFDAGGGQTRRLVAAPESIARAAARRLRENGRRATPLLAGIAAEEWPAALPVAAAAGFAPQAPAPPEPGTRRWPVIGAPGAGSLPLVVRTGLTGGEPRALALLLGERPGGEVVGDEVELARQPIVGIPIEGELWLGHGTAWLLSGSVAGGEPLRRAVGLRRGSLARGEAQIHNGHGYADYSAGDLASARREFDRAIAADPRFVDALYNAASTAALEGRPAEAIAYLRRAVEVDARRVQVLGRDDDDLKVLRRRPEVRALLGMKRAPPETSEEGKER
jgi:tetratricopeptide (TPR) repeat protein